MAELLVPPIGRLPWVLIAGGKEIEITPAPDWGTGGNGCGNVYHWGHNTILAHRGLLEEIALHEGSHL